MKTHTHTVCLPQALFSPRATSLKVAAVGSELLRLILGKALADATNRNLGPVPVGSQVALLLACDLR